MRCASRYWNPATGSAVSTSGAWGQNYSEYNNINTQQTLNWAHDYGKHHVDAMIGHEFNWNRSYGLNYKTQTSLIPDFQAFTNFLALNGGATFSGIGGSEEQEALEGYFMRANYNYDNKYYVTASVRGDGSSKFRYNDTRWGTFWSVGGAWRLSGESWLADATWLTDLKLRADYGVMGNQGGVDRYSGYQQWNYRASGYDYSGTNVVLKTGWNYIESRQLCELCSYLGEERPSTSASISACGIVSTVRSTITTRPSTT
ncbi:MAG: hypothetical protein ACLTZY_00435 [Alistipes indistinctus]